MGKLHTGKQGKTRAFPFRVRVRVVSERRLDNMAPADRWAFILSKCWINVHVMEHLDTFDKQTAVLHRPTYLPFKQRHVVPSPSDFTFTSPPKNPLTCPCCQFPEFWSRPSVSPLRVFLPDRYTTPPADPSALIGRGIYSEQFHWLKRSVIPAHPAKLWSDWLSETSLHSARVYFPPVNAVWGIIELRAVRENRDITYKNNNTTNTAEKGH